MGRFAISGLGVAVILGSALPVGAVRPVARAQSGIPGATPGEHYTPVVQSVPTPPRWFLGTDGLVHLVYELRLTNGFPVPVTVTSAEVLDASDGRSLSTLSGEALATAMSLLATGGDSTATVPPSTIGVVWFDVTFAGRNQLPAAVEHRVTVGVPPGLPIPATIVATGGRVEVDRRPPVVLGPPLRGPRWVALGSCRDGPHRRSVLPLNGELYLSQRFAIDFNLLDAEDRLATGDLGLNTSYPSYGQPVIAVTDATVVAAVDRFPDQVPNAPRDITLESADGNHVILDLGDGRYAFYAHLRAGSVAVRTGDRVQRGQAIGELGNSGSSSGPHLHFHVMDRPSALVADGLPYVFDRFELAGRTPPIAETIARAERQEPIPIDARGAVPRRDALPFGQDLVAFPE